MEGVRMAQVELDPIAEALNAAGYPGIIAKASEDGNGFLLQWSDLEGRQLELRRPAPGSRLVWREMRDCLEMRKRSVVYLPKALKDLDEFVAELNGRSRIKSVITIELEGGDVPILDFREYKESRLGNHGVMRLEDKIFTGRDWILVACDE